MSCTLPPAAALATDHALTQAGAARSDARRRERFCFVPRSRLAKAACASV
jgi:hypothetical protein